MNIFNCPTCGSHQLIEVLVNATVFSDVANLTDNCVLYYENEVVADGEVYCYKCSQCGFVPELEDGDPVSSVLELLTWIKS